MSDSIKYSLVLKSQSANGAANDAAIADLSYSQQVSSFFQKVASVHNCTKAKLEIYGIITPSVIWSDFEIEGIDIVVRIPYLLSTSYNTNGDGSIIMGGLVTKVVTNNNANYELAYKSPVYLTNLSGISEINIRLFNSLTGTLITNANCPSYSIMFILTPIFN